MRYSVLFFALFLITGCATVPANPNYGKPLTIGMSEAQVIERCGNPAEVHNTVTAMGTDEQWCWGIDEYRTYAYFHNGVLTGWQNNG